MLGRWKSFCQWKVLAGFKPLRLCDFTNFCECFRKKIDWFHRVYLQQHFLLNVQLFALSVFTWQAIAARSYLLVYK